MKILFHHQKFYQTDLIKRIENEDFVRSSKIILDSISDQTRTLNHVQLKKELYFFSDETHVTHCHIGEDWIIQLYHVNSPMYLEKYIL